jgi:bacteriocin-like protein
MKKINLRGISEILSEKELKNVMGGSGNSCPSGQAPCSCNGASQGCKTLSACCSACGVKC